MSHISTESSRGVEELYVLFHNVDPLISCSVFIPLEVPQKAYRNPSSTRLAVSAATDFLGAEDDRMVFGAVTGPAV
jgi:hypothetical protein